MNAMHARLGACAVLAGCTSVAAIAATKTGEGRIQPAPNGAYSVYSPGPAASAAIPMHLIQTPQGTVQMPDNQPTPAASSRQPSPGATTIQGPDGLLWVMPGFLPDPAAPPTSTQPTDADVIRSGPALLRQSKTAADAQPAAAAAAIPPGVRVIDLPAGAVAPTGMPEFRTLYRVTRPTPAPSAVDPAAR